MTAFASTMSGKRDCSFRAGPVPSDAFDLASAQVVVAFQSLRSNSAATLSAACRPL